MNAIELTSQTNNLSFILLLISFSIIGLLYAFHYKYSKELILSVFSQRNANQYLRDENVFKRRVNIFFNILMTLNISVFICIAIFSQELKFVLFLNILFFTCLYYSIKFICIWFIAILLKNEKIINTALFFTTLFDKVFSLFCFPLLILFHFFSFEIKEAYYIYNVCFIIIIFSFKDILEFKDRNKILWAFKVLFIYLYLHYRVFFLYC